MRNILSVSIFLAIPCIQLTAQVSTPDHELSSFHENNLPGNTSFMSDSGRFFQSSVVPVDSGPWSATAGDWDNDGDLDLVIPRRWSGTVAILLNDGEGNFSQSQIIEVGQRPLHTAARDLDNDGDLDLAVTNWISNTVSILTNNGSGHFTNATTITVGSHPQGIAGGDIDGDGDTDLLVANSYGNSISVLINNGDGSFSQSPSILVEHSPAYIITKDFDNDGDVDFAVANYYSASISVLLNNGIGTFSQITLGVESTPSAITTDDWNGDGHPDLAAVNNQTGSVTIFNGDGAGHFDFSASLDQDHPPGWTIDIASGDWNRDGYVDFAVTNGTANSISVYENDSTGRFREAWVISLGGDAIGLTAGDWNKDGRIDLAVTHDETGAISILENTYPLTGINNQETAAPRAIRLGQNYPNPFNLSTRIPFSLPASGYTVLEIFDMMGRGIATIIDGSRPSGAHTVQWDAAGVSSGVYYCRLVMKPSPDGTTLRPSEEADPYIATLKLILLR